MSLCLPVCPTARMYVCLSVCLSVSLSTCHACLTACLPACLPAYLSAEVTEVTVTGKLPMFAAIGNRN
jgi:hypothetical protein